MHRLFYFEDIEPEEEALQRRAESDQSISNQGNEEGPDSEGRQARRRRKYRNIEYRVESQILKYYLSLAMGLQNIVSAYYVTIGNEPKIVQN